VFSANVDRLRGVLFDAVAGLPAEDERDCLCTAALGGMDPGFALP
jgi:5'-methylthioadenosine phosphorylase